MRFSLPLFNPSYWSFLSKGTHTPHLSHLLFDRTKFPEDLVNAVLLHRTAVFLSVQPKLLLDHTSGVQTISVQFTLWKKQLTLPNHTGVLTWCITPGSIIVYVYFALGKCCSHRIWARETETHRAGGVVPVQRCQHAQESQQMGVTWPASVRPSRVENTESQGYSSTFISVIRQNFRPITASNPGDYIDDIILACCVSCPVWEAGQNSFLWCGLSC